MRIISMWGMVEIKGVVTRDIFLVNTKCKGSTEEEKLTEEVYMGPER